MKQIRIGTFETNSSSTHTMVVCTEEEFKKWVAGELLVCNYDDDLFTPEKVKEFPYPGDYYDYDNWMEDYERGERHITTKSGDKLVIAYAYGQDY